MSSKLDRFAHQMAALCAVTLACAPAMAAPTYYFSRAAFNAAAGSLPYFESFETLPPEVLPSPTITYPNLTFTETNGIDAFTHSLAINLIPGAATHGNHYVWYDDNGDSISTLTLTVAPQVNAVGLDLTADETSTISIGGDANSVLALTANQPRFFGVIDPTGFIDTLVFNASGGPNLGFDAVAFGNAVPEPTTMALALVPLGVSVFRRRR